MQQLLQILEAIDRRVEAYLLKQVSSHLHVPHLLLRYITHFHILFLLIYDYHIGFTHY